MDVIIEFSQFFCVDTVRSKSPSDWKEVDHKIFSNCFSGRGKVCLKDFGTHFSKAQFSACAQQAVVQCKKESFWIDPTDIKNKQRLEALENARAECRRVKRIPEIEKCGQAFQQDKNLDQFFVCRQKAEFLAQDACVNVTVSPEDEYPPHSIAGKCFREHFVKCKEFQEMTENYNLCKEFLG